LIPSSKRIGKYENDLVNLLNQYFEERGYRTYPHVQLNIAWGNIISDIDLIVESGDMLFGIEVKSRRDDFRRIFRQIDRMSDFFDGIYVASDKSEWSLEKKLESDGVGLLIISNGQIIEKKCEQIHTKPRHSAMMRLRKICLSRLATAVNGTKALNKKKLASHILAEMTGEHLRLILKSIVTCTKECETNCPIWNFEKELISPLRNVESILRKYGISDNPPLPLIPANSDKEAENSHRKDECNRQDEC
jgi:hypothetical protein